MRSIKEGSITETLRASLDGMSPEFRDSISQIAAEYILAKALEADFGFFKLLVEIVDGRIDVRPKEWEMADPDLRIVPPANMRSWDALWAA